MNGYNMRPDLFKRNDRVVRLKIKIGRKVIKEVTLADRMGWHEISFPPQDVARLELEFTGIRKGEGKDHELCLSELELLQGKRAIDFEMPSAALYSLYYCCGGEGYLITRSGRLLAKGESSEGLDVVWNARGNRIAGSGQRSIWIADPQRAQVLKRIELKRPIHRLSWADNHTLSAEYFDKRRRFIHYDVR